MSTPAPSSNFELHAAPDGSVEIRLRGGGPLLRYVVEPDTPADEAPRPYAHPVRTLAGEVLTNFRPNDHRWHHALSYTLTCVSGYNFWGGGSYRPADGYQHRGDQGVQRHREWRECGPDRLAHRIDWCAGRPEEVLLSEERALEPALEGEGAWTLRWRATLRNVAGRPLRIGHYQSTHGLQGSHYSGLQFRGTRDLLDDHGDPEIGVSAPGGLNGVAAVHGAQAAAMEWRGSKDTTLRRVGIRFEHGRGPMAGFVRRNLPLASFPPQIDTDLELAPGAELHVDHRLTFTDL